MLKSLSFVYKKIKLKKKDIKERERKRESHREKPPNDIFNVGISKITRRDELINREQ